MDSHFKKENMVSFALLKLLNQSRQLFEIAPLIFYAYGEAR